MKNNTKKLLMLGGLLLGCALTSVIVHFYNGNNEAENMLKKEAKATFFEEKNSKNSKSKEISQSNLLKIYVSGAVMRPGLYDVPQGSRADDAITLAGGMTAEADLQKVNLARLLKDGMQVNVPYKKITSKSKTVQNYSYGQEYGAKQNSNYKKNNRYYNGTRKNYAKAKQS